MSELEPLPRPEYPRPQLVRETWQNLNGSWEFSFDDTNSGMQENWQDGRSLQGSIVVPYAYQTELSGIHDTGVHEVVWYARTFAVPGEWVENDLLLHFGAVDYRSSVWVNGKEVGHNQGGHVPFSFNIAPYLHEGENRITVRVEDSQDAHQPRGKQAVSGIPQEIDYYCTTGIWQTVWLEPVSKMRIEDLRITPLVHDNSFELQVYLHAPSVGWRLEARLIDGDKVVGESSQYTTNATSRLMIPVHHPKYWSPENPHLYDIEVLLYKEGKLLDKITTYGGFRSVGVQDGHMVLNGKPYYLRMVLDQGYWPESGMTAPTDQALKADVEWALAYGFNGVRKHQKIEDPRWLYWCDKLGVLVWGEMANARAWTPKAEEWFLPEWERAVRRDYNHPCIIAWVPMNESWGVPGLKDSHPGQYAFLERIVSLTRRLDHFRPVIDNDGWEHSDITDICAIHDYTQTAEALQERYKETLAGGPLPAYVWLGDRPLYTRGSKYHGQPVILTEVGGFLLIPDDVPPEKRDILYTYYGSFETSEELLLKYEDLMKGIASLPFVAGFCYTQLVDIEQEINGLLTYDRKPKVDPVQLSELHRQIFNTP
jgi:beta-galactosidase/beta-glucuronidase